jgi:hypothetical protein
MPKNKGKKSSKTVLASEYHWPVNTGYDLFIIEITIRHFYERPSSG